MFLLSNKTVLAVFLSASLCSCALIDLRIVGVETYPAKNGEVLPARDTPLRIRFDSDVEKPAAEEAFSVKSEEGTVEGDIVWKTGNEFFFAPLSGWKSGLRYRLGLSGSVRAADGREARPAIDVSFFAIRSGGAPAMVSACPGDGATVGVKAEDGARVVLTFSEAMDGNATEDAFSVKPAIDFTYSWNGAKTTLTAEPKTALAPCVVYRWALSRDAKAVDGSPIAREETGSFFSGADGNPPSVARTCPAVFSAGSWIDSGGTLADLDSGQAVIVEFSEAMDEASARGSVTFSPALSGRTDVLDSRRVVFVPDKNPESGKPLTLIVSADAKDVSGLRMGTEYRETFMPAVPYLKILRVEAQEGEFLNSPKRDEVLQAAVSVPDGILSLSIRFSSPIPLSARAGALSKITLVSFFPGSLSSPALRSASWPASDTAVFIWEDLERSPADYWNYYLLSVSGGGGGVKSDMGLTLEDDVRVLVEAKR